MEGFSKSRKAPPKLTSMQEVGVFILFSGGTQQDSIDDENLSAFCKILGLFRFKKKSSTCSKLS